MRHAEGMVGCVTSRGNATFTAPTRYHSIVKKAALAAGALGVPGAFSFGLDISGMSGIWIAMTLAIAKESGHEIDQAFAAKFIAAVTAGVAGYVGGSKVATTLLHLIPGAGREEGDLRPLHVATGLRSRQPLR